jgi:CRISPR system Cascade subunit CasB
MAKISEHDQKFIKYLQTLVENRAALAHLRRGLGQSPGTEPQMFPYVASWVGAETPGWAEKSLYLIAALFAYHPDTARAGNMGDHFASLRRHLPDDTSLERRFVGLLAAHPEDLGRFHLRQVISYLKSHEIPVNWAQLLADVRAWGVSSRYVQTEWARAFWAGQQPASEPNPETKSINQ